MLTFCWLCFLSLLIILYIYIYIYIFIDPFHNGDPKEVSWNNTLKRLNCSPCRPSSTEAKQNPQQQQKKDKKREVWNNQATF